MVMWPCAMRISMLRREPWPDCAMTFCSRSRFEGLLPPWRSVLPLPRRLLRFCFGLAHSGTTPPGHSSLCWGCGLSRMGVLRGVGGCGPVGRFFFWRQGGRFERDEVGGRLERGLQLVERRKLLERPQIEIVEEFLRGGEDRRAPGRFAVAHDVHPAALDERVEGGGRHGDAADFLDVAARHRLAVGDDGEGL